MINILISILNTIPNKNDRINYLMKLHDRPDSCFIILL